jgi:hypothetical protein
LLAAYRRVSWRLEKILGGLGPSLRWGDEYFLGFVSDVKVGMNCGMVPLMKIPKIWSSPKLGMGRFFAR